MSGRITDGRAVFRPARPGHPGRRPGPGLQRTFVLSFAPLLLALAGCSTGSGSSQVHGVVLDHRSGNPIAGATVILERRGWGRSDSGGGIVWDKRYRTQGITDEHGTFSLQPPGPTLLAGRDPGVLSVEADGFHALRRTRVEGGARVSLHTIPDHEEGSPGGTARVGRLTGGRAFGWSFVESRAVTEPERADLLVQDISASETRVTLTVPRGGGLLFIPLSEQEIGTPAEGHLLRFIDEPPRTPVADRLTLDSNPGTLFLRTRDGRYAKLAWDPEGAFQAGDRVPELDVTAADEVFLPFVYRPLPGRFLPFQPPVPPVDPLFAAAGAELNDAGDTGDAGDAAAESPLGSQGSRRFILELRGSDGSVLDSRVVTLEPDRPEGIQVTPRGFDSTWRYENLLLRYDDRGLPRVGLRIMGPRSSHNFMPKWVTRRLETEFRFDAYLETGSTPVGLTLAIREEG